MEPNIHIWDLFSCCPGEHTLSEGCLARVLVERCGVRREIVGAKDENTFRVITTWPSGDKSQPWTIDRAGWMMLWTIEQGKRPAVPHSVIEATKKWLGDEGHQFFGNCLDQHGRADPVLPPEKKGYPPHPVHFREGMQVRNFLRGLDECQDWTDHDYDNVWAEVVTRAVRG